MILKPLQQGSTIAIVATARKISREELAPSIELFSSWGLQVVEAPGLYEVENQMAGSDQNRTQMLQWALDNDTIDAIICARGGYGTVHIIDQIDFTHFVQHPKWIIGYSDVTVLHNHIQQNFGIPTLHAIMPINIPKDAVTVNYPAVESLKSILFGEPLCYSNPTIETPLPSIVSNRSGYAEGILVGGNLSIIYSLLGSPSDINTDDKILFIEDLDEYLYHIDRMIMALKRASKFNHLKGLIVGAMSDMHDNTIPFGKTPEEIISDAVKEFQFPVFFNGKFGHIGTENLALPLGNKIALNIDRMGICTLSALS